MNDENFTPENSPQPPRPERKPRKPAAKQTQRDLDQIEDPVEFREARQARQQEKDQAIEEVGFLTADILADLGESAEAKDMEQHELIKRTWGHPRERVNEAA